MPTSPVHPQSIHHTGSIAPARLCGWSNQGNQKADGEALQIHKRWIRRGSVKGKS